MKGPAAKEGDLIIAVDIHQLPPTAPPVVLPFSAALSGGLSTNVTIMGRKAAVIGSEARGGHPQPVLATLQRPPSNTGSIVTGSSTVFINGKGAARHGDTAITCNDPFDLPVGQVTAAGTVRIGD